MDLIKKLNSGFFFWGSYIYNGYGIYKYCNCKKNVNFVV